MGQVGQATLQSAGEGCGAGWAPGEPAVPARVSPSLQGTSPQGGLRLWMYGWLCEGLCLWVKVLRRPLKHTVNHVCVPVFVFVCVCVFVYDCVWVYICVCVCV